MNYVIICQGLAGRAFTHEGKLPPKGQYLESYDPEAHHGRGEAAWTSNPAKAMKFSSQAAAWACWSTVPRNRQRRADGQPNKPLTAFTVMIEPEP